MSIEIWKRIPGFIGYDVSNKGNVRSYYMRVQGGHTLSDAPQKILNPSTDKLGRKSVGLWHNNKQKRMSVHRLVLMAFVGLCPRGSVCCHNDGDMGNNILENLRWDTYKANEHDKLLHGKRIYGEKQWYSKLTESQVKAIRFLHNQNACSQRELAKIYDVCFSCISSVINKVNWKHI